MDFSSLTEFPRFSQVTSPSDATALPHTTARGVWPNAPKPDDQAYALGAGETATPAARMRRRREEEDSPRTPFTQDHGAAQRADAVSTKLQDGKDRIALLPLDLDKPEAYENWRRSTQAAVACRAGMDAVAMEYLTEIDNPQSTDAQLSSAAKKVPALRILDMLLYTAILRCIEGGRRETALNRIHAPVEFRPGGHGAAMPRQNTPAVVGEAARSSNSRASPARTMRADGSRH